MLDADAQGAAEEGDGVFGDELFEGYEEGGGEGDEALEGSGAVDERQHDIALMYVSVYGLSMGLRGHTALVYL